jgi:beta-N-acetylhexosaminidase
MTCKAWIVGCSGKELSREEKAFFKAERPWGFILFKRNVESPDQVRKLVDAFRKAVGRTDAPVLIDQEGGRVQRLGPPHWPVYPAGRAYGKVHSNDPLVRREIARLGGRLMAHDLHKLGITVDCVLCLMCRSPVRMMSLEIAPMLMILKPLRCWAVRLQKD